MLPKMNTFSEIVEINQQLRNGIFKSFYERKFADSNEKVKKVLSEAIHFKIPTMTGI